MQIVDTTAELRGMVAQWRSNGERVAFVPTMGNLHAGHLQLVDKARALAARVVVSIYVNPMQFGESEDLARYPRTLEVDRAALERKGVDLLFAPSDAEVYPLGHRACTRLEVPGLSDILCGAHRPGHFIGVATVVCKLFNMVQPDVAVFGEKDYQQLLVIRRMTADLCIPVDVVSVATVRETDGLAMSSRNAYLSLAERDRAPRLYEALGQARERIQAGECDYDAVEAHAQRALAEAGFRVEYFSVRRADDLVVPAATDRRLVVLAAAWLGKTRLIDNVAV